MKRLYKLASLSPEMTLELDGKPVKTPGGHLLVAPNRMIGEKLVQEWAAQEREIIPSTTPFTQFLSTKLDRVIPQRVEITAAVLKYLDTDLVCYRTAHPPALAVQQAETWDPWLAWFEDRFSCRLQVTTSLAALQQDAEAKQKIGVFVQGLNDDVFNILQFVTSVSGSLVLATAFIEEAIMPETLLRAMRVEEDHKAAIYNEAHYGSEPLQERRDAAIRHELAAAAAFLQLLKA